MAIACVNNKVVRESNEQTDADSIGVNNVLGIYGGKMPCTNCDAIETVLSLSEDYEFKLRYKYQGKSDQLFEHEGKWSLKEGRVILEGVDYTYKVRKNSLQQLDLFGEEIKGDIASRYMLKKIE